MKTTNALLITLTLLALVSSASAECAWVMWTHIETQSDGNQRDEWVLTGVPNALGLLRFAQGNDEDAGGREAPIERRVYGGGWECCGSAGPRRDNDLHVQLPPRHGGPTRAEGEMSDWPATRQTCTTLLPCSASQSRTIAHVCGSRSCQARTAVAGTTR